MPVLGLTLIAIVSLVDEGVTDTELALTSSDWGRRGAVGLLMTYQAARSADPVLSVRDGWAESRRAPRYADPVYDGSELGLLQAGFNRMAAACASARRSATCSAATSARTSPRPRWSEGSSLAERNRGGGAVHRPRRFHEAGRRGPPAGSVERSTSSSARCRAGGAPRWLGQQVEGDAALAVFGAPIPLEDAAASPGRCAPPGRPARRLAGLEAGIGVSAGLRWPATSGPSSASSTRSSAIRSTKPPASASCPRSRGHGLASACALERAREDEVSRWREGEPVKLRGRKEETTPATPA